MGKRQRKTTTKELSPKTKAVMVLLRLLVLEVWRVGIRIIAVA